MPNAWDLRPLEARMHLSATLASGIALGGPGEDFVGAVATDSAGNVYAAGLFRGTVDFRPGRRQSNLTSAGDADIFVAKYSPAGALVWAHRLGGRGYDYASALTVDSASRVYLTGQVTKSATFDGSRFSKAAGGFVARLDAADGSVVWSTTSAGIDARAVTVDARGDLLIAGAFAGVVDFDPGRGVLQLRSTLVDLVSDYFTPDIFVWKVSATGRLIWARSMGGDGFEGAAAVATDSAGNVYTSGTFTDQADFDPGRGKVVLYGSSVGHCFVSKLSPDGTFAWVRRLGGTGGKGRFNSAAAIAVDGHDDVCVAGGFVGTLDFDPGRSVAAMTSAGGVDAYLWKLSPAGKFVWARQAGGRGDDAADGLASDAAGNFHVAGHFASTALFGRSMALTSRGGNDAFIASYAGDGATLTAASLGGKGNDGAVALAVAPGGHVFAAGSFQRSMDLDPYAAELLFTSRGDDDGWLIQILE